MSTGKSHAGVFAPPPLIYLGFLSAGLVIERLWPGLLPWSRELVEPTVARILGVIVLLAGIAVLAAAVVRMRQASTAINPYGTTTSLVTTGIYGWSRNPMYVGLTLVYLGLALLLNYLWPFLLLPIVLIIMNVGVIQREERYLHGLFGEEYARYQQRVRRWL